MKREISIIGSGLSGSEAALQMAARGYQVKLYEMRPNMQTEAHQTGLLAELVCSNSLKSTRLDTGSGLLKAELQILGCQLLPIAQECSVPAGHALAVDRALFAARITAEIEANPQIQLIRQEMTELPEGKVILATGPLSSPAMMHHLKELLGEDHLFFFDAIAPIIDADSIDRDIVYAKSRYDKGEPDYLNCAFEREEYYRFVDALLEGEKHEAHEFEDAFFSGDSFKFYENCIPIEELAKRGRDTLRHGVMRPMGLEVPATGRKAYAVLQLRSENSDCTAYNLVGCQTMLRYPEQKRIFKLIPGLEQADFLRYGSIHRNSYLNSPLILNQNLSLKAREDVWIAGQLGGVEGYVECIATGMLVAGIIAGEIVRLPEETILGQMWRRILTLQPKQSFSPVNANFGLLPALPAPPRDKKLKRQMLSERAIQALRSAFPEASYLPESG